MTEFERNDIMLGNQWRENLAAFGAEHRFPEEAGEELADYLEKICKNRKLFCIFRTNEEKYWENPELDYDRILEELRQAGEEEGISPYVLHLLFFIGLSRRTWEYYEERGISREIFHDSMEDLRCKLLECHQMYGIWGSFVAFWFPWWFSLKRFALGRLQFELIPFGAEYEKDGLRLTPESKVLNVHIPSSGPLTPDAVKDSYRRAAGFYRDQFPGGPVVFVCDSWLLFPAHKEILPESSNIRSFGADYDIIETSESNSDLWRIFYSASESKPEELPEDTGLKRAYKDWLMKGHMAGNARGVYVWQDV